MASNQKVPWTVKTFREKKPRGGRVTRSLSLRQKRAEYKCVQKLVDFQYIRENTSVVDCSKLPTPRPFHTPKPRRNLSQKFNKTSKKLEFDVKSENIWESRGLSSWENYTEIFRKKCNLISMEDVKSLNSPKISTLDELLKQSKESSSSDSGHAESNTESPLDTLEQVSDLELFMSSDSEDFQGLRNCEMISSDDEEF